MATAQSQKEMIASHTEMHGSLGDKAWPSPRLTKFLPVQARPGYDTCEAHEYAEASPEVLVAKVQLLASLMRRSRRTILYTGAGISTSSGIPDYASRDASGERAAPKKHSGLDARPTVAHRILSELYRRGMIQGWVQQNHDGLPQKAGLPQSSINEIHGAWFDPSNPVVQFSGNLRSDLFHQLLDWEEQVDLCIVLGTSLAGMNADRIAVSCGRRAHKAQRELSPDMYFSEKRPDRASLGMVLCTIQKTKQDHHASLRLFDKLDDVMIELARQFEIPHTTYMSNVKSLVPSLTPAEIEAGVFVIPYDASGNLSLDKDTWTKLDLRPRAKVRITSGPHEGCSGEIVGRNAAGHYEFFADVRSDKTKGQVERRMKVMGAWFLEAAVTGALPSIPVVNARAVATSRPEKFKQATLPVKSETG